MISFLCVVGIMVLVAAMVGVVIQMANCGWMWMYHVVCDTPGNLCRGIGWLFTVIVEINRE